LNQLELLIIIWFKRISLWTSGENKRVHYDVKAKNIIPSTITLDEFYRNLVCSSVKEMWGVLEVTHKTTEEVKRARKNILIQEYEMFRMQLGKTIYKDQKKCTHIINHLLALGKTFDIKELNIKIVKI